MNLGKERIHFRSVWGVEDGVQVQCQRGGGAEGALLRLSTLYLPLFIDLDIQLRDDPGSRPVSLILYDFCINDRAPGKRLGISSAPKPGLSLDMLISL